MWKSMAFCCSVQVIGLSGGVEWQACYVMGAFSVLLILLQMATRM